MLKTEVETKATMEATMAGVAKEREADWFMPVVMGFGADEDGRWLRLDGSLQRPGWQLELTDETLVFLTDFREVAGADFNGRLVRLNGHWGRIEWWRFFGEDGKRERAVLFSCGWQAEMDRESVWQDLMFLGQVWQWRETRPGEAGDGGKVILLETERLRDWWPEESWRREQREIYKMVIDKRSEKVRVDDLAGWLDEEGRYWAEDMITGRKTQVIELARTEQERQDTQQLEEMLQKAKEEAVRIGGTVKLAYRPTGSLSSVTAGDIPVNIFRVDENGTVSGVSLTFRKGTSETEIERELGKYLPPSSEGAEINSRDWREEFWHGGWRGWPVMVEELAGTRVGFLGKEKEEEPKNQENQGLLRRQEGKRAGLGSRVRLGVRGVESGAIRKRNGAKAPLKPLVRPATEIETVAVAEASAVISGDSLGIKIKVERKVEKRRKERARLRVAAENGAKEAIRANEITNNRIGFGSKLSVKKPDSLVDLVDADALSYINYINDRRPAVRNMVIGTVELESVLRRSAAKRSAAKLRSELVSIEPRPCLEPPALAIETDREEADVLDVSREARVVKIDKGEIKMDIEDKGEVRKLPAGRQSILLVNQGLGREEGMREKRTERKFREQCREYRGETGEIEEIGYRGYRGRQAAAVRAARFVSIVPALATVKKKETSVLRSGIAEDKEKVIVDNGGHKNSQEKRLITEAAIINRASRVKVIKGENEWSNGIEADAVKKTQEKELAFGNDDRGEKERERERKGREEKMRKREGVEGKAIYLTDGRQSNIWFKVNKVKMGMEKVGKVEIGDLTVNWLVLPRVVQPELGRRVSVGKEVGSVTRAGYLAAGAEKETVQQRLKMMRLTADKYRPNSHQLALMASILIVMPHVFIYLLEIITRLN